VTELTQARSLEVVAKNVAPQLCAVDGLQAIASDAVIASGSCYGVFGDLAIKPCSLNSTTAAAAEATLGAIGSLTVLELQAVEGQTADDSARWLAELEALDLELVYSAARRVVAKGVTDRTELPRHTVVLPVLTTPMKKFELNSKAGRQLQAALAKFGEPDPLIQRLISAISAPKAKVILDHLTGVTSSIKTRNSIAPDGLVAAKWIEQKFKGYGFETELDQFRPDYNPNVIATLKGEEDPDTIIIVGAHYDSRQAVGTSATLPAPGANDDGSGTQLLLQLAEVIHTNGIGFKYTLVLGAWGGEEQGLVGSRAYALACKNRGDNIVAMLQADMIAFRSDREGIQNGFANRYASQILTDLAISVMNTYTPEVETCYTSVCCSDHQSFYEQGYAGTQFFERCGNIIDDKYHDVGDVVDRTGFDLAGELVSLSRGVAATALTLLEPIG